ncbi:Protein of unknown function, partial [Gryllus bimaculatus]
MLRNLRCIGGDFIHLLQRRGWSDGFFVRHPEAVVAPLGDEAALKCVLRFPAERLRWRKDGRLLPPPNATADAAAAAQHAHPHAHAHAHPHQGP